MKIKHQQDVDAPADYVFSRATDFVRFERMSGENDVVFQRIGSKPIKMGTQWKVSVPFRGRKRRFTAELIQFSPPRVVSYSSATGRYQAVMSVTITPKMNDKCKMEFLLIASSRSVAASMAFNLIRLARRRINKRLREEMEQIAVRLAQEYREENH